jgi:hypothetical protein
MTQDKHKGIHDPWRLGTKEWQPPAGEKPTGTPGSDDDFDWDLVPDKWYVFRLGGAALKVMGADEPVGAVLILVRAYKEDEKVREVLTRAGFTDQLTGDTASGFVFNAPNGVLCCPDAVNTEDGLQRLNRALRAAIRADRSMQERLTKLGIIPLVT